MERARTFRRQIDSIADHPEPVLSVYLNVNSVHPENQGQAYLIRLKDALKQLGAPRTLAERVWQLVELERVEPRTGSSKSTGCRWICRMPFAGASHT